MSVRFDGVVLELGEFCIETAARRAYQQLKDQALEGNELIPEDEEAMELLRMFLEQENFSVIRDANEDLCGGRQVRVRIFRDDQGKVCWSRVGG